MLGGLAFVPVWLLLLAPTSLGGPLSLIWVSGVSMEPTLHTGDLAVLYREDRYGVGDIVAFEIPEGGTVIHRVIEVETGGYRFRGDNRQHDDPWTLSETWIRGRQIVSIPEAAHVMSYLGQPWVMAVLVAGLVVLARLRGSEPKPGAED